MSTAPSQPKTPDSSEIPVKQPLMDADAVTDFDLWMDDQLRILEASFRDFVTAESAKASFGR